MSVRGGVEERQREGGGERGRGGRRGRGGKGRREESRKNWNSERLARKYGGKEIVAQNKLIMELS